MQEVMNPNWHEYEDFNNRIGSIKYTGNYSSGFGSVSGPQENSI